MSKIKEVAEKASKMKGLAVFLVVILSVGLLGMDIAAMQEGSAIQAASGDIAEEAVSGIPVSTINPETGSIAIIGEYMGTVEPNRQVTVLPKAAGEVLFVYYNVGDHVSEGDILFEIDSAAFENQIAQTEATLSQSQAAANQRLADAKRALKFFEEGYGNTIRNAEIAVQTAETNLNAAQSSLKLAEREKRAKDGNKADGINQSGTTKRMIDENVRTAQFAVERAELGLEQSIAALNTATGDGYAKQLADFQSAVQTASIQTNMDSTLIMLNGMYDTLENYTVKAPISGIIEMRNIEPYGMAAPQSPAFIISDMNSVVVSYKAARESRSVMNTGDRVEIEDGENVYYGTVTEISTGVDMSGLFTVKATIHNAPSDLYAGVTVRVYTIVQEAEDTLVVPLSALYYERGVPYVYIAKDGLAHKTAVEVGLYDSERAEILSGIELTDQIISTWSHNLTDGAEIVVVG